MIPENILQELYSPSSRTYKILLTHGRCVAKKALSVADRIKGVALNRGFIEEAAVLHDIGIYKTDTPSLGCFGDYPYICHGYFGRLFLEKKGFLKHALVCERHIGVGISVEDINTLRLPLAKRDMQPVSIEEQIICYADKFFSKSGNGNNKEKSITDIVEYFTRFGDKKVKKFLSWVEKFE